MKDAMLVSKRIASGLLLLGIIVLPCYSRNVNSRQRFQTRERIIVELAIDGWGGYSRLELPFAEGANRGGGGGISPAVNISGYRLGLSVLKLRKKAATLSLNMILQFADGTERKLDESFLVVRGKKSEYQFAYGVKIKSYVSSRKKNRTRQIYAIQSHSAQTYCEA